MKNTTLTQLIEYRRLEQKYRRRIQCLERGECISFPDGFFGRCFNCGIAQDEEVLGEDIKFAQIKRLVQVCVDIQTHDSYEGRWERDNLLENLFSKVAPLRGRN